MPAPDHRAALYAELEQLARRATEIKTELTEAPKPQKPIPAAVRAAKRWHMTVVAGLLGAALWCINRTKTQYVATAALLSALGVVGAFVLLLPWSEPDMEALPDRPTTEPSTPEPTTTTTPEPTTTTEPTPEPGVPTMPPPGVPPSPPSETQAVVVTQPAQPVAEPVEQPDQPTPEPPTDRQDQPAEPEQPAEDPPSEPRETYCADLLPSPTVKVGKCVTDVRGLVEEFD